MKIKKVKKQENTEIEININEKNNIESNQTLENISRNKKKKEKNKKKISIPLLIFRLISLIIILICLYFIWNWHQENLANASLTEEVTTSFVNGTIRTINPEDNANYEFPNVNFEELTEENEQSTAWIKVNNTNINFPIVQGTDNSYYLTHNFNNQYNKAGWIFADYRNNLTDLDQNTIIYGHNRQNGTMFGNLLYFLKSDWYNDQNNTYFLFSTTTTQYVAKIFTVYKTVASTVELKPNFDTVEEYQKYLDDIKSFSIHDFNVNVTTDDHIITLFTCDNNTKNRVIIQAKLEANND